MVICVQYLWRVVYTKIRGKLEKKDIKFIIRFSCFSPGNVGVVPGWYKRWKPLVCRVYQEEKEPIAFGR